ncbi:MAG: glycosyltransferase family 61 protein [Bacteroidetes bacterium]|nr:glycosyltransferase family 61 protein [Bacteroidota bacterium]
MDQKISILQPSLLREAVSSQNQITDLANEFPMGGYVNTHPSQNLKCRLPPKIYHTEAEMNFFLGKSPQTFDLNYHFDSSWLASLPYSSLIGNNFIVISGQNKVIKETYSGDSILQQDGRFLKRKLKVDLEGKPHELPFVLFRSRQEPRFIKKPCLLPVHYWHFNYHHWLIECLPRFQPALDLPELADCPIIVPQTLSPWQRESLKLMGIPSSRLMPFDGQDWRLKNLYFPSIGDFSPHQINWVRGKLLKGLEGYNKETGGLFYISRSDANHRKVVNEEEVADFLENLGFQVLTLTGMPLSEQLELFASAKVVIGPHGAGLTNMLVAPAKSTLVELMPDDEVNHCFWLLTNALKQDYTFVVGKKISPDRDFEIPIRGLEKVLKGVDF